MNRAVLIVTPYFAPQAHAAVFRAYKLAKYLPEFGWKPYVVTTDRNYLYPEDPGLLDALPAEVEVVRAPYIEPTLRGIRMALGGPDRSFATLSAGAAPAASAPPTPHRRSRVSWSRRLYQATLDRWLHVPDAYWTWRRPALRTARALARAHRIRVVFTSANPYTSHLIGHALQRDGLRWVADLRDPHTYCARMHSRIPAVFQRQRAAERSAVERSDAVTVAAASIGLILRDTYGLAPERPLHFIPTGLDEALVPAAAAERSAMPPYLLFSGEFLPEYGGEFFRLFAAARERAEIRARGWRVLVVGRREVNEPRILPYVRQFGLQGAVEFRDHLPQTTLYQLIRDAAGTLLVPGHHSHWWCLFAKMVDYIALRKPVLAAVPDPSEARTQLRRTGLGVFLDGPADAALETLLSFLRGEAAVVPRDEECDAFLARAQVASFSRVFEQVASYRPPIAVDEHAGSANPR